MLRKYDLELNKMLEKSGGLYFLDSKYLKNLNFNSTETSELFEAIKNSLLENSRDENANVRATQSFSKVYAPQIGYRISRDGINWEVHRVYEKPIKLDRFAIREKIHIFSSSFDWLKSQLDAPLFERLVNIYEVIAKTNEELKFNFPKLQNEPFLNQMMLIKYSTSAKEYDYNLNYLGSTSFGDIHDDETLYSVHLGDTSGELQCFDYEDDGWTNIQFKDQMLLLLGRYSLIDSFKATSHRLIPTRENKSKERYSFIVEYVPAGHSSVEIKFFEHHENHKIDRDSEKKFVIDSRDRENNSVDKKIVDFTEEVVRFHYFFELMLNEKRLVRLDKADLNSLSGDRGQIIYIEPGFVPRGDEALELLLKYADLYRHKYFVSFHQWHPSSYMSVLNWNSKNKSEIIKLIKRGKIFETFKEFPFYHIDCKYDEFGSGHVYAGDDPRQTEESLEREQNIQKENRKRGFDRVFVFNTENYNDLEGLEKPNMDYHLIGLSSGFKLFALWSKLGKGCRKVSYFDINRDSLALKKSLIQSWDGRDLIEFLGDNHWNLRQSFLGDKMKLEEAWQKELSWWGGEREFQKHWMEFKLLEFDFYELDLLKSIHQLFDRVSTDEKNILWASNVWYNEFSFSALGQDYGKAYTKWLKDLVAHDPQMLLLQAPETTLFCNKMIHGKPVSEILREIS